MSELADLLSQLVAIDSVNPDLVPGAAGEGEIAAFIAEWLERAGLEVHVQEAGANRPNVIGIVRGTGGGTSLMLNAHMDVVSTDGMTGGWEPRVEGSRLYGRGAWDMKGSLAAIMLAGADLVKHPPRGDVLITAVVDEEHASIGTAAIVGEWSADAAIVTEPSAMEICVAHKGFVWIDIETSGVAAHGSRPHQGVDAIAKMGHILIGIENLDRSLRAHANHPLLGTGSIHASLIEGGSERSTYPASCLLRAERRTVPGETVALVESQMTALVRSLAAADPDLRAEVRLGLSRAPFEISLDQAIVQTLRRQVTTALGRTPDFIGESGWMDSALLSSAGIPTVIFGPRGAGAHSAVEWVDLDDLDLCRRIYVETAREFCG